MDKHDISEWLSSIDDVVYEILCEALEKHYDLDDEVAGELVRFYRRLSEIRQLMIDKHPYPESERKTKLTIVKPEDNTPA